MEWQPIETAPKDRDVLVWYDHDADPYRDPDNPNRLTDYAAWAESGDYLVGRGIAVAKWTPQFWESTGDYGEGYWMPPVWAVPGSDRSYAVVCNPTHWMPLPEPPR